MLGRLEGWDPLLTTEEKKYGLSFFSFFFFCALRHCEPSPVQQNSSKDNTAQGKSKHCWLERCGNIALVHWWHAVKQGKKKRIEVHFLINGGQAGNEQRLWSHVRVCGWLCRENVTGAVEKAWSKISPRCTLKASLFSWFYGGTKVGFIKRHFLGETLKKNVSFSAHLFFFFFSFVRRCNY